MQVATTQIDPLDLTGRVALVTGAGRGIGATIAATFARHGARVVVNDFFEDRAHAVATAIRDAGGDAVALPGDVSTQAGVDAIAAAAVGIGPVQVLVNNAGAQPAARDMEYQPFIATPPQDWAPFLDVSLYGTMRMSRAFVPDMVRAGWGRVLIVGSEAGRIGLEGLSAYAAAKAGATGFMRCLAAEVGRYGVTANCMSMGGVVHDGATDAEIDQWYSQDKIDALYPRRRIGRTQDAADAALFLCSGASDWITGQTVPVNGGMSFAL